MPLDFDALVLGPCVDAFGEMAQGYPAPVYTVPGNAPFDIDGIFDAGNFEVRPFPDSIDVNSSQPMLGVRLAAFPAGLAPAQGDLVTIRSVAYIVNVVQADSHGGARLMLTEEAS